MGKIVPQEAPDDVHQYRTQSSLGNRKASGRAAEIVRAPEWNHWSYQSFHAPSTSTFRNLRRDLFCQQIVAHGRMRALILMAPQRKQNYRIFAQDFTHLNGGQFAE